MAALALFVLFTCYWNGKRMDTQITVDGGLFLHMQFIGAVIISFCCMFVGTEYSDGTIRNKMIVGHSRTSIYLANLFSVVVAGMLYCFTYLIIVMAVGIPLFGIESVGVERFLFYLFASIMSIIAISSIITMLSMCIQNRTVVAIIGLIAFFVIFFAAIYFYSSLKEQPILDSYIYQNAAGEIITVPEKPNPSYITGIKRTIYQSLLQLLPTGQTLQIASMGADFNWKMPLYSLCVSGVFSVLGILLFRKKDIK